MEFYKLPMTVVSFFCQITPKRPLIGVYTDVLPALEVGPNRGSTLVWRCLTLINDANIVLLSSCYFIFISCHGLVWSGRTSADLVLLDV